MVENQFEIATFHKWREITKSNNKLKDYITIYENEKLKESECEKENG